MESLEARLGYVFRQRRLLDQALTLPAMAHERKGSGKDYQRLEFLGDAVVDHVVAEALFRKFPDADEGSLTNLWIRACQEPTMAQIARALGLHHDIVLSRGEESAGRRNRDSTLADSLEAVIGAVHMDGGFEASRKVIESLWRDELATLQETPPESNPKGQLQELLQVPPWGEAPTYRIVSEGGPDHLPSYKAVVVWRGQTLGTGTGASKQKAQVAAAQNALGQTNLHAIIQAERKRASATS